jgi:hypothetical protein
LIKFEGPGGRCSLFSLVSGIIGLCLCGHASAPAIEVAGARERPDRLAAVVSETAGRDLRQAGAVA